MTQSAFENLDALLDASMDDLADLPPMGVPPTGNYQFSVTASREISNDKKSEYFKFAYEVLEIGEVKSEEDVNDVKVGMKFTEMFSPFKKDGSMNEMGIGFLKERTAPFSVHFGTQRLGETIQLIQGIVINATLVRRQDKKDETRFNFSLKDVVIL